MTLSLQTQAVMLLTVSFGKSEKTGVRPLSTKEWARFSFWLKNQNLEPQSLLKDNMEALLSGWKDESITLPRLEDLMARGGALGLALERWQRTGLWVITRSDPDYPERLKRRLRFDSPPVLFGCGEKTLLGRRGIAVIGSRNTNQEDIVFTKKLGDAAAGQKYAIISGGARGVDENAMLGALENKGKAVGVMADSLLRAVTSAKYRKYIASGELVLVTPFNPEAGFNVGNAMSRNRYIYCLADAAVVVSSTPDKGGTWNGATEALNAAWVPLWVKRSLSARSGNAKLAQKGARWIPDDLVSLDFLLNGSCETTDTDRRTNLPLPPRGDTASVTAESMIKVSRTFEQEIILSEAQTDLYSFFLIKMHKITADGPVKAKDIAIQLELNKSQADTWLRRGVADKKIIKMIKPVRYQSAAGTMSSDKQLEKPCTDVPIGETKSVQVNKDSYYLFLRKIREIIADNSYKADDIAIELELEKSQVNTWLKRGIADGVVRKTGKPVRYQSVTDKSLPDEQLGKPHTTGFYSLFLTKMREITATSPAKAEDIATEMDLGKSQINAWLKRGIVEGHIKKMIKPVRYQSQSSLFTEKVKES